MMTKTAFKNITDRNEVKSLFNGFTSLKGYLGKYTAADLERVFGPPLYRSEHSGDGKVKLEWVVVFTMFDEDGDDEYAFTVYDWKNYDMTEYSLYENAVNWHIGGSGLPVEVIEEIIQQFKYELFD